MSAIIEISGLTKRYGRLTALADLDLQVEAGSVFGFVGPNGAGKTTTMRILATLLRPTAGTAWVAGHSVTTEQREVRRAIGYMPDFFGVYGSMKVAEYLDFFAACYNVGELVRTHLVAELLDLVDLSHRADDYVDALSRGMQQRLCLARTLAHDPQVLILDEPASGLDPRARVEMRELLLELRAMGKTIFISSHILSEMEELCSHIGIIEAGRLVAAGTLDEIRQRMRVQRTIGVDVLGWGQDAVEWLSGQPGVAVVEHLAPGVDRQGVSQLQVSFGGDDEALAALLSGLIGAGFKVIRFEDQSGGLEGVFLQVTTGEVS